MHTDFPDTGSDSRHGFPAKRLQPLLDPPELDACESAGVSRERSHIAPGRGNPLECLLKHGALYKYQYILSTRTQDASHNCRVHLAAGLAPMSRRECRSSPAAGDA